MGRASYVCVGVGVIGVGGGGGIRRREAGGVAESAPRARGADLQQIYIGSTADLQRKGVI